MKGKESLGFGDSLVNDEALEKGREFLAKLQERIGDLTETVEGYPRVESIDIRIRAGNNERLLFMNNGMVFKQLIGIDVEGRTRALSENEMVTEKVIIPVDNIDITASGKSEEVKAYLASTPADADSSGFNSCIAVYERYRVDSLMEHDIAIVPKAM